jgi:hypothetical protein
MMVNTKLKRRKVSVDFWPGDTNSRVSLGSNGRTYKGRLLGLITDKEFTSLIKDTDIQKKCYTSATIPLSEIVDNYEDLDGYRMTIAVKEIDGKSVIGQKLFVTERLSLVSYLNTDRSAGITGENGAYMMIEEEVIENET